MLSIHLINHLLQQNPEVCQQLSGYNGIVIAIKTGSLNIVGRINQHGLLDSTRKPASTTLILHDDALPKILQGQFPTLNDLAIEGDMELGIGIMMRGAQLRYTPQQDLRRIFGDETVERVAQKTEKVGRILTVLGQTLMFQAASIAPSREQQQLADQLAACTDALNAVQNQLEQANRRLDEMERQLKMYDVD
ncbi:hypothetical protein MIS46_02025 [Wielerella bovis]|uniref:SCP2 sterol-binding domain-containing protein n=1 Tax=Wielerella bovis TaxID=2917790 RepID=UPI002019BDD6|nr:SCP2 sterol-binding domain-containing protein [Wielerella bovis]ULJ62873.1 hypothetical protein MIS46_02025 [Wielerella bovis]